MTLILLSALGLFLWNPKKITRFFPFALPVFVLWAVFFPVKGSSGTAFFTGMILLCLSPLLEKLWGKTKPMLQSFVRERFGRGQEAALSEDSLAEEPYEEEDILNRKDVRRLIWAGFIVLFLLNAVSIFSVFRINAKINSLYEFSHDQELVINEQSNTIRELNARIDELSGKTGKEPSK